MNDIDNTLIHRKGDGLKSLLTLALYSQSNNQQAIQFLAIEEPESNLHPEAIHNLRKYLRDISKGNKQVIIATHNPIFVENMNISSNYIVNDGSIIQANKISDIRKILGIKSYDNLINAQHVLLVEGESDVIILSKLITFKSPKLFSLLENKQFQIFSTDGANKMSFWVRNLMYQMYNVLVLTDSDVAGNSEVQNLLTETKILKANINQVILNGYSYAEIENIVNRNIIESCVNNHSHSNFIYSIGNNFNKQISDEFNVKNIPLNKTIVKIIKTDISSAINNMKDYSEAFNEDHNNEINNLIIWIESSIFVN